MVKLIIGNVLWDERLKQFIASKLRHRVSQRADAVVSDVLFQRFRSPVCPVYPPGSTRGQREVGGGCWPPGPTPLRCYDDPVAAAVQSFTAWRQNLLAMSAAAAAAGATSGVYQGRGLEHHRSPSASSVIDGSLSLRFDHCRLPTALMMSHHDGSDLNNTGLSSFSTFYPSTSGCAKIFSCRDTTELYLLLSRDKRLLEKTGSVAVVNDC